MRIHHYNLRRPPKYHYGLSWTRSGLIRKAKSTKTNRHAVSKGCDLKKRTFMCLVNDSKKGDKVVNDSKNGGKVGIMSERHHVPPGVVAKGNNVGSEYSDLTNRMDDAIELSSVVRTVILNPNPEKAEDDDNIPFPRDVYLKLAQYLYRFGDDYEGMANYDEKETAAELEDKIRRLKNIPSQWKPYLNSLKAFEEEQKLKPPPWRSFLEIHFNMPPPKGNYSRLHGLFETYNNNHRKLHLLQREIGFY